MAAAHAARLLDLLGMTARVDVAADHPALGWRRSGLFALTGEADGPPLMLQVPLTVAADGILAALRALAPAAPLPTSGAVLLGERARLLGLTRRGAISPGGGCRLLRTRDGHVALSLARTEDWELLPALFGSACEDWPDVARVATHVGRSALVARGRELGLAVAAEAAGPIPAAPFTVARLAPPRPAGSGVPLVVDLSALWAGPLAGSLLALAGGRVVKVESLRRPDGARAGHAAFHDLLNAGKASVALDFTDAADLARLRALLDRADIVIEGTRPRALAQLGIDARAVVRRGATWVSITGHGRSGAAAGWVGFGDDTAVAGGLATSMRRSGGRPIFAGDAIADPLTGMTAALAAWAGWRTGGGRLISIPLRRVVAHARGLGAAGSRLDEWQGMAAQDTAALYPLRQPGGVAAALGADTAAVLAGM